VTSTVEAADREFEPRLGHERSAPAVAVDVPLLLVDTADVAALDGHAVVEHVLCWLNGGGETAAPRVSLKPGSALKWISPTVLIPGVQPPRARLLAWPYRLTAMPTVTVRQDGTTIARRRLPWPASPGRAFRIRAALIPTATGGGNITIDVA
jgi:hypothetical protein